MRYRIPDKARAWIGEPLSPEVVMALDRLAAIKDVERIAIMPDVHLAEDVCVGTCVATRTLLLPAAVGGDIGCGMAAIAFDCEAAVLEDARVAAAIFAGLYDRVPSIKHSRQRAPALAKELEETALSHPALDRRRDSDGRLEFGTLGRGNHFVELQSDEEGRLWVMLHSGSRAMGQTIRDHHVERAKARVNGLATIEARSPEGIAYLHDMRWALRYAEGNRRAILNAVTEVVRNVVGVDAVRDSLITCQHNHVQEEEHFGMPLLVHRKGAIHVPLNAPGIIPGSMGTRSFHVSGKGEPEALCSASHGAGRAMSRSEASRRISSRRLAQEMEGIWYDHRLTARLRDEAPSTYKDVRGVMRAQQPLVSIVRRLTPLLSYKGT